MPTLDKTDNKNEVKKDMPIENATNLLKISGNSNSSAALAANTCLTHLEIHSLVGDVHKELSQHITEGQDKIYFGNNQEQKKYLFWSLNPPTYHHYFLGKVPAEEKETTEKEQPEIWVIGREKIVYSEEKVLTPSGRVPEGLKSTGKIEYYEDMKTNKDKEQFINEVKQALDDAKEDNKKQLKKDLHEKGWD